MRVRLSLSAILACGTGNRILARGTGNRILARGTGNRILAREAGDSIKPGAQAPGSGIKE
jgi:hypothetical protein